MKPHKVYAATTTPSFLDTFAFLLCFVLYVYVMIFQFEIKHKVPSKRTHIIQEHKSNIAFFSCRYKISYALNFWHALLFDFDTVLTLCRLARIEPAR